MKEDSHSPSRSAASNNNNTLPLRLSVHPNDGCLLTAPLYTVLNAATDSLYRDLHDMTYGNVTVAVPSSSTPTAASSSSSFSSSLISSKAHVQVDPSKTKYSLHSGTMASLSFAQRRFQLASQLIHHARSISHVAALVAAYLPVSSGKSLLYSSTATSNSSASHHHHHHHQPQQQQQPCEGELSHIVTALTNVALHQVQTSWTQADEAQDALYFKHADLYKHRKQVHDIFGAMEVLLSGSWKYGMSWDVMTLFLGRPSSTTLNTHHHLQEEDDTELNGIRHGVQRAVQSKLFLGEMGSMYHHRPWNLSLEQDGCVVKLTYGTPQSSRHEVVRDEEGSLFHPQQEEQIFPLVAYLTVLSEQAPNAALALQEMEEAAKYEDSTTLLDRQNRSQSSVSKVAPWTLLSIEVNHRPKMGESNYQLSPTNRQLFDLHRICLRNMAVEESRAWVGTNSGLKPLTVARPLDRLFDTMHTFSLALQMEMLSAQAMGLKKGTWSHCIMVEKPNFDLGTESNSTHIQQSDHGIDAKLMNLEEIKVMSIGDEAMEPIRTKSPFATLTLSFWDVDDRYGSPAAGQILLDTNGHDLASLDKNASSVQERTIHPHDERIHSRRLTLVVQAVRRVGVQVKISGGKEVMDILHDSKQDLSSTRAHLLKHVNQLLVSILDPFRISMSDALLAATTICAQLRCIALVRAFERKRASAVAVSSSCLPSWLHLHTVESGCVAVASEITYHGTPTPEGCKRHPVVLFHLTCESRTGQFVTIFPKSFSLLRRLACNDTSASETQTLRQVVASMHSMNSSMVKRKQIGSSADKDLTGRFIRDAFEALNRSMDVLGRRIGVGGEWVDHEKMSSALRAKYIDQACDDVKPSLMLCSALAATYGVACVALGISTGVDAMPDIAGGPIENNMIDDSLCMNAPALSVLRGQRLIDKEEHENKIGDMNMKYVFERDLLSVSSTFTDQSLMAIFYDIVVEQDSLYGVQNRVKCRPRYLEAPDERIAGQGLLKKGIHENLPSNRASKRSRKEEVAHKGLETFSHTDEISYLSARLLSTLIR